MLLLPLLLFWARRPMQFNGMLLKTITSIVVTMAVLMPLCAARNASAADRDDANGAPQNSFREDEKMGHQPALADANGEANPMRPKKLREGTLVPPTVGRFVPVGRRWMFVPDGEMNDKPDLALSKPFSSGQPANVFRSAAVGYPSSNDNFQSTDDSRNRLRDSFHSDSFALGQYQLVVKNEPLAMDVNKDNPIGLPQIVAVENLMLQRVVEAIRVDGADDRWKVSGQLTEYFDENRLQVKTAERSTSK